MNPQVFLVITVAAYLIGGALSVILPYARKYFEGEVESFSWRKAGGRVIAVILVAAPTLLTSAKASELQVLADSGWLGVGLSLLTGLVALGAGSIGHQAQGAPKALRARKARKQA